MIFSNYENLLKNQSICLKQSFSQYHDRLQEIIIDYKAKRERWKKEEQTLNIVIMGQVKAGKSSFLNALLFDGLPILPEAATPKTANLTKVIYGERYSLEVEYYNQKEWTDIQSLAKQGGDSSREKVARELISMARQHANFQFCGKEVEKIYIDDLNGLQGLLNRYSGNDGEFTAFVKSTTIAIPNETLKGFAVVDTPGMNDPVQSRSQKTRDYMAQSDVVFFLSRCSQFLDSSDIDLLFQQLPSKGVKRLVVIAGQFDSAILDDGYDRNSLDETINNIRTRLTSLAKEKIAQLRKQQSEKDNPRLTAILQQLASPIFASTFAYGFANWPQKGWGKSMQHTYLQIQNMAKERWGKPVSLEEWTTIANFDELVKQYQQARSDREKILKSQIEGIDSEAKQQLSNWKKNLKDKIIERINLLDSQDITSLKKQESGFNKIISTIRNELSSVINDICLHAEAESNKELARLEKIKHSYSTVTTRTGTEKHKRTRVVSDSTWYNPFSWFSTKTENYTVSNSYEYILVTDVIEQVRKYGEECADSLSDYFNNHLINKNDIRIKLRKSLIKSMDTTSEGFNSSLFKETIDFVIRDLTLPTLELSLDDSIYINLKGKRIRDKNKMDELVTIQQNVLSEMLDILQRKFKEGVNNVFSQLHQINSLLADNFTKSFLKEIKIIERDLNNIEEEKQKYQDLLNLLNREFR